MRDRGSVNGNEMNEESRGSERKETKPIDRPAGSISVKTEPVTSIFMKMIQK